jgi:hypothetical protein
LKVTMYGTGEGDVPDEEVEVEVELEEVSVVDALLAVVVSVLVEPSTASDSPNAPEAISPNAKRTAKPIPIRRNRFRSVR